MCWLVRLKIEGVWWSKEQFISYLDPQRTDIECSYFKPPRDSMLLPPSMHRKLTEHARKML